MERFTNPDYLRNEQYKTSNNLSARIRIHELFSTNTYDLHRWAFDMLLADTGTKARILEIGCGRGDLWAKNRDRIPVDWQVTLTDFSAGMWADAKNLIGESGSHFDWQTADVQALPFEDQTYDTVIANFMLYHVPDRVAAIHELRRVLKPGGSLHTMTVGAHHMSDLFDVVTKFAPDLAPDFNNSLVGFQLENGAVQLKTAFDDVQTVVMDNNLKVNRVEPLIDYLVSSTRLGDKIDAVRPELEAFFQAEIAAKGHFFIRKSGGLFVSRGYAGS